MAVVLAKLRGGEYAKILRVLSSNFMEIRLIALIKGALISS